MPMQFAKADTTTGHDAFWNDSNDRVLIKTGEIPAAIHPDGSTDFWDQFDKCIKAVSCAKDGSAFKSGCSSAFEAMGVRTHSHAAELVHRDRPSELMDKVAKMIKSPWRTFSLPVASNFIDRVTLLHHLLGMGAHVTFPSTFAAKWANMVARPEEVAGAIARGELDAPDHIKRQLFDMVPQAKLAADQKLFSFYPEGCPPHPSYPGGHATHAGWETTVIKLMFNLSAQERDMVDLAAENIGHFRETAGVHYRHDDVVGLWIGQECANRYLPKWFERELGVTAAEVEAALAEVQTDWVSM